MKRLLAGLTLSLMVGLVFGAGAGEAEDQPSTTSGEVYAVNGLPTDVEVTLKLGFFEGGMGRAWIDHAIQTFETRFPNVTIDTTYSPNIGTVIEPRIASGDDEEMFDLFAPKVDPQPLARAGKIVSQEELWDHEVYDSPGSTLRDVAIGGVYDTAWRIDGENYTVPVAGWIGGLFYDRTFFEENGWNQDPRTFDEFVSLCEDIQSDGVIPISFTGIHKYNYFAFRPKMFEIAEANGRLDEVLTNYRNQTGDRYADPANITAHERMHLLGASGFFSPGVEALNHTQSQMQVLRHDAAMVISGSWVENEMKDATPEGFDWGYMALPFTNDPDGTIWTMNGTGEGLLIWAEKPELNVAWSKEFVVWLWNLDVQEQIASSGGQLPVRADFMNDAARAGRVQQAVRSASEYINTHNVRLENMFFAESRSDPMFNQAWQYYEENIVGIVAGGVDPEPILEDAQRMFDEGIENEAAAE
jgi:N-acetylglucosamine transport system substrate-binding protein